MREDKEAPRFERLESDCLQTFLVAFSNEDLAPVVDVLVGAASPLPGPRLKDTAAYKEHAPDHRRYRQEIEADLRAWGSHEIMDAGNSKPYRDIVADLCSQKGVKTEKEMSVLDMERLLLKKLRVADTSASPWGAVGAAVATSGGVAALAGWGAKAFQVVAPRALGVIATPLAVIGAAWTAWESLGPGYRVTGPCVLAIAQARLRLWCAAVADSMEEVQ